MSRSKEWWSGWEAGYEDGQEEGYQEAADAYFENPDIDYLEVKRLKEAKAQRDAAWEYLREKEIHLLDEKCWCSPIRHMVAPK